MDILSKRDVALINIEKILILKPIISTEHAEYQYHAIQFCFDVDAFIYLSVLVFIAPS